MQYTRIAQRTVLAAGAAVLGLQFLPAPPRTNPRRPAEHSINSRVALSPQAGRVLERACADCHSNETRWPWYSAFAPFSWIVGGDVERGRQAMNLSEWTADTTSGVGFLVAACEDMKVRRMPPPAYVFLHPDSRLSRQDIHDFCGWTQAQINALMAANRQPPAGDMPITSR